MGYCPPETDHELRGRIITPIYNVSGELVALSTRHLDKDHNLRFWHESFDKGYYLYGLYNAKDAIRKYNKVTIVEGEFDVASFHSFGFNMTVGCCGSAFTLFQIALLSRYCTDFYLLFDGDTAGKKSIHRALDMYKKNGLEGYGLNFIPVFLPDKMDPDEFLLQNGVDGMKEKLRISRDDDSFI